MNANNKLRSFNEARAFARSLNLFGKIEWHRYCYDDIPGLPPRPDDIPIMPGKVPAYRGKWKGMPDWLGYTPGRKDPRHIHGLPKPVPRQRVEALPVEVLEWKVEFGRTSGAA